MSQERVRILDSEEGRRKEKRSTDSIDSDYVSLNPSDSSNASSGHYQVNRDGGWGWVIVAASFLCNMVLDGIGYSFGVMLQPLAKEFGCGTASMSFVGSLLMGGYLLVGPIAAASVNRYGTRKTCITGSLISSIAIFSSSFSGSVACLVITYGIIGGIGIGFMYVPAVVAVGEYFSLRLSLATGICVTGSGVGTILFAPFSTWLVSNYGWRGCNRVMALLCLACSLCGLVMKPVPKNHNPNNEENIKDEVVETIVNFERIETSLFSRIVNKIVNKQLVKSVPFRLIWIGNLFEVMGVYCPYVYLPMLATSFGISASNASFLISVVGITNTIGRILSGWFADFPKVNAIIVTVIALIISGIFSISFCLLGYLSTSSNIYIIFIVICGMFGFFLSAIPVVTSAMLVDVMGIEMLTTSFGALNLVRGISVFLGPPISGFVLDKTGNYNAPFYISGGLLLVSAVFHIAAWIVKNNTFKTRDGYHRLN